LPGVSASGDAAPEGVLAWSEQDGSRAALRSGRRVPGRIFILGGVDGTQVGRVPRDAALPDDILCYEADRNSWNLWTEAWPAPVVTSPAVALNGDWAIVSGEIKRGQRTTDVWAWHI